MLVTIINVKMFCVVQLIVEFKNFYFLFAAWFVLHVLYNMTQIVIYCMLIMHINGASVFRGLEQGEPRHPKDYNLNASGILFSHG